ncbi:MAG: ribosome-associated translation inhibitor RaiA [Deltaproteobacteria bacterium]
MRFQVSGRHLDVGDALQEHVKTEVGVVLEKFSGRPTDALVIFSRDAHEMACEAVVHLSTGLTVQAKGQATEIYAAFADCAEKMEKQLRRYKRRLKDHHKERVEPVSVTEGTSYVLQSEGAGDDEPDQPIIIAESLTMIPTLSVGEAVMQMELNHAAQFVFRNAKHQGINVVYKRDDGNVGWVDPR